MREYDLKIVSNLRLESDGWETDRCKATCTYKGNHYEVMVIHPHLSNICTESYEEQALREIESGRAKQISKEDLYKEEAFVFWR